jgi:hypothetical protein
MLLPAALQIAVQVIICNAQQVAQHRRSPGPRNVPKPPPVDRPGDPDLQTAGNTMKLLLCLFLCSGQSRELNLCWRQQFSDVFAADGVVAGH